MADELSADYRQAHEPHVDDDRLPGLDQMFPVERDRAVLQMAGNEHAALRVIAVCQWYAGVGGTACRRRDAGNDLKGDPFRGEGFDLLATSTEDERIASFQAQHPFAFPGEAHEQRVDILLG